MEDSLLKPATSPAQSGQQNSQAHPKVQKADQEEPYDDENLGNGIDLEETTANSPNDEASDDIDMEHLRENSMSQQHSTPPPRGQPQDNFKDDCEDHNEDQSGKEEDDEQEHEGDQEQDHNEKIHEEDVAAARVTGHNWEEMQLRFDEEMERKTQDDRKIHEDFTRMLQVNCVLG